MDHLIDERLGHIDLPSFQDFKLSSGFYHGDKNRQAITDRRVATKARVPLSRSKKEGTGGTSGTELARDRRSGVSQTKTRHMRHRDFPSAIHRRYPA